MNKLKVIFRDGYIPGVQFPGETATYAMYRDNDHYQKLKQRLRPPRRADPIARTGKQPKFAERMKMHPVNIYASLTNYLRDARPNEPSDFSWVSVDEMRTYAISNPNNIRSATHFVYDDESNDSLLENLMLFIMETKERTYVTPSAVQDVITIIRALPVTYNSLECMFAIAVVFNRRGFNQGINIIKSLGLAAHDDLSRVAAAAMYTALLMVLMQGKQPEKVYSKLYKHIGLKLFEETMAPRIEFSIHYARSTDNETSEFGKTMYALREFENDTNSDNKMYQALRILKRTDPVPVVDVRSVPMFFAAMADTKDPVDTLDTVFETTVTYIVKNVRVP